MYYINLASTRGYFMRLANQKLQATKAKSDIVKLEIIRKKRETELPHRFKKRISMG